jgi:hypothetical protein
MLVFCFCFFIYINLDKAYFLNRNEFLFWRLMCLLFNSFEGPTYGILVARRLWRVY